MWSQVGLRKHHYEQSWWRWWNSSWAISDPERWCCESAALNMPANLKISSGHRTRKGQFSFHSQRKAVPKNAQTTAQLHSSLMLKILQARLQQYMNCELPDVQAGFRKGRGTRDQFANIRWIIEKTRQLQKNIYFCFIDHAKAFVWIITNCGKFWKRWIFHSTWPTSWEICR